ncbi:serine hydrolase domain-containing protein [Falsiroseomonas selenitidurans]|uniref:Beta-lactamase family protein n=1 Tax=Falsiroseomonas selenitidurans TaxID=2716335 RepID=A0ABX1ED55_9PROT|nr:serine hydrolase domain-containing protein [Falsiroseomonas selenitidurans]NKC33457.1 beta-lactamase family protein [Falsiroseomonas selenitidurans]
MQTTSPEDVGLCARRLARIDTWRQRLVTDGKVAGATTLVMRRGQVAHLGSSGVAHLGSGDLVGLDFGTPMTPETIHRIYSMTKPITSVAIMMLYEEGRFQLDDPISRFLPYFANQRVCTGGARGKLETVPAMRCITFRDLLTHTSGLTYGFMQATAVDALYREQGIDYGAAETSLAEVTEALAKLPLVAEPGTAWNYSVSTDVLGHLVEVISGQDFESFLHERLIGPLGMVDTGFHLREGQQARLAANYARGPHGALQMIDDPATSRYLHPRAVPSGGGGLVSTAADYLRFCRMLLNKGQLDGVRYLGRKTVELMMSNHLRGDMAAMGQPRWSESTAEGIGFGLGFSVMLDPARAQILGTPGECAWGGAASTAFWVDPAEAMAVILLTQLMPSSTWPLRRELRVLSYQAVID